MPARRPLAPVTLADLTADLVWPRLLRVGHVALRPSRLGMALVWIIGMMLLGALADRLDGRVGAQEPALGSAARQIGLDLAAMVPGRGDAMSGRVGAQAFDAFVGVPAMMIRDYPWVAFIAVPLMALWTAIFGGAISRSAACDFARGVSVDWPQAIGFGVSRCLTLLLAIVLPLLIIWLIALGLAVGGWALFSLPVLNIVGAVAWPLFLLAALVASVMLLAYAFGAPLLVPSVTCEGTDALDAVQHAYSFVFARPLRLVIYLAILAVQLVVMVAIVAAVFWLAVHFAQMTATHWAGLRGKEVLGDLPGGHTLSPRPSEPAGASKFAKGLSNLWTVIPVAIPLAFVVSFFWSGSTVLYLAMRRVVDGQDMSEIWMPGIIPGTMAQATPPAPAATPAARAPESVSDTGPADES